MSKWTPGPWEFDEESQVVGDGALGICDPLAWRKGEEARANGRLIAAAPEMADELKHICDLLDSAFGQGISIPGLATTNKARALLARVEGE